MNQIKLLLVGILIIGILLLGFGAYFIFKPDKPAQEDQNPTPVPISIPPVNTSTPSGKTLVLQANESGWKSIGSGKITIHVSGTIDFGGQQATPDTSMIMGDSTALVPGVPFGAVVGKIGENGKPFKVGSLYKFNTSENVYIAINDSTYSDNTGSYTITIER